MMTIAEMEKYLKKNKHIKQNISGIRIVAGVSGASYRQDSGWKETLSKVAEAHPMSALASEMGTRSTKQIKTVDRRFFWSNSTSGKPWLN